MIQVVANFGTIGAAGVGYLSFDQVKAFKAAKKAEVAERQAVASIKRASA